MSDSISEKVIRIIKTNLGMRESEIVSRETKLDSLSMDSLDEIEIIMYLEKDFDIDIHDSDISKATTVQDIIDLVVAGNH